MTKSISDKIWLQKPINEEYVYKLTQMLMISDLLAKLLASRANDVNEAQEFLSPKLKNMLPDPFHLMDMQKAVERTIKAIKTNEQIYIFADYDVDGATASALLKLFFMHIGINTEIYVPDRIKEGYGLNNQAINHIKQLGGQLMITVDCGTSASECISYASDIGLDCIVIDHHMSVENPCKAIAIINPNRIDETSEYKYLAAVGVAFLFVVALAKKLDEANYFNDSTKPNLLQYLDLVALGTVCDAMQIISLNRAFVAQGLKVMTKRQNIGIKAICDIASVDEPLNCYHLGFVIGPRINAGGRVGKANHGANLLTATYEEDAVKIAYELEKHNAARKEIELAVLQEAIAVAHSQINNSMLFITGNDWHPGVIGIVASRVKDLFNKPVAIVAIANGIGKASCRSIESVNFGNKIIEAKNRGLVLHGGGHAMAGGFTAKEEDLPSLHEYFNTSFYQDCANHNKTVNHFYDIELTADSINNDLMDEIARLEPFGNGNLAPVFKFSNLFVLKANIVGNNHINCILATDRNNYKTKSAIHAICFNSVSNDIGNILLSKNAYKFSAIGSLKRNNWQQNRRIQLQIKDIICTSRDFI